MYRATLAAISAFALTAAPALATGLAALIFANWVPAATAQTAADLETL